MAKSSSNDKPNGATEPTTTEQKGPELTIQRIYVKDLSLETPNSPQVFQQTWHPKVDVQLNAGTEKLADNVYEIKLSITVTAKTEDKVAFLAEVQQAGIFTIAGFPEAQLQHILGSYCPTVLFPFARELVADLVVRGGFPPLYLAPINFEALYEQKQQQAKTTAETATTAQ